MTAAYIFDIDGTIADLSHRLPYIQRTPKNWPAFFAAVHADKPIKHICELARILRDHDKTVVFVSGRSDECRDATEAWLAEQMLDGLPLYMRQAGDHRPDHVVKGELLDDVIAAGFEPQMVFEDRASVVAMWRERGIPCAQVAEGDF